jgi:hypothetical protein
MGDETMNRTLKLLFVTLMLASVGYAQDAPPPVQSQEQIEAEAKARAVAQANAWINLDKCPEFLPINHLCAVLITILDTSNGANPAPTHADVTLRPGGAAAVVLSHASPLMNCTVSASPSPLARDASSSITTFLTTIGTLGAPAAGFLNPPPPAVEILSIQELPGEAGVAAKKIDGMLSGLGQPRRALEEYKTAQKSVQANWRYSYPNDEAFTDAAHSMFRDLRRFQGENLPSMGDFDKSVTAADDALSAFKKKYWDSAGKPNIPECNGSDTCLQAFRKWLDSASFSLQSFKDTIGTTHTVLQFLIDAQSTFKPAFEWLFANSTNEPGSGVFTRSAKGPWTTIYLPMSRYAQKQVTETITCKDVVTKNPVFDNITLTAYYERNPSWDLSAGAVISLVPGHQVGPISGPLTGTPPTSPTILGITSQSAVQFVPAAIFEFHPSSLHMNRKCPWVHDGTGDHPWGYVCTFGPAVGFLVNPNNGTTSAEFFEGVSFGIHRLSFLFGNHTGRFQQFAEGYTIGETVPSGATPPTTRRWTNHPAFGITYRIPIR